MDPAGKPAGHAQRIAVKRRTPHLSRLPSDHFISP
jgi:hypothetical protein